MHGLTVNGVIRRRLLINFRVEPEVIQAQLPAPFRPKLLGDQAVAGICLIRLEQLHPQGFPLPIGLSSENAAHRIAVVWDDPDGHLREGVFIPRRDSNSYLNHLVGGRLVPGVHQRATFQVDESPEIIDLRMQSQDGSVAVAVRARRAEDLPPSSHFASLAEASAFFEGGAVGYSARPDGPELDGLRLRTQDWRVKPLAVDQVTSSYFADEDRFPAGSVAFDCALLMERVHHQWEPLPRWDPSQLSHSRRQN
jgi:hypothetical protein